MHCVCFWAVLNRSVYFQLLALLSSWRFALLPDINYLLVRLVFLHHAARLSHACAHFSCPRLV